MKLIVGLGNPGLQYQKTRHNIGFLVIDELCSKRGIRLVEQTKFHSQLGRENETLFIKPQTFMNDSGKAVSKIFSFYKIAPTTIENQSLVVIHDDLDLPLGSFKAQFGTGPKVHNGLQSIYDCLGTKDFIHLRIGIDGRNGNRSIPGKDYVLQPFLKEERILVDQVIQEVVRHIEESYVV